MALRYEGLRRRALEAVGRPLGPEASKRCAGGGPRGRGSQRASRRRASEASLGALRGRASWRRASRPRALEAQGRASSQGAFGCP